MGTELVDVSTLSPEELMAFTGQSTGPRFNDFPRLSVNKVGEDDQGRQIPSGAFCVSQGGIAVYGKPVVFRPFINVYQYAVYDEPTNTYPNRSVLFKSFSEEAVDELGGISCGKITKKNQVNLTEDQIAQQKKIKCYRNVYGVVSFEGKTADGQSETLTELPVKLRLSGDNFMPMGETLDKLAAKRIPMILVPMELSTERKKQGTNVWYRININYDLKNQVKFTDKDVEIIKEFQQSIDNDNKRVVDKYKASKRKSDQSQEELNIINSLEADFHSDNIEDVGRA